MSYLDVSRRRHASWALTFQGVSLLLSIVRGVVLVPLYLHYIPIAEYGYWVVLRSASAWLFLVDPGFADLIRVRTAGYLGTRAYPRIWCDLVSALSITTALCVLVALFAAIGSIFLDQILGIRESHLIIPVTTAFAVLMCGLLLMPFSYIVAAVNDGLQQGWQTGAAFVTANILSILATIILLYMGLGIFALALGLVVIPLVFGTLNIISLLFNMGKLGAPISVKAFTFFRWKVLLRDARVNLRGKLSNLIVKSTDRWIVARVLGAEAVVPYDLMKRLPEASFSLVSQLPHAFAPTLSNLQAGRHSQALSTWSNRLFLCLIMISLGTSTVIICNGRDFLSLWVGNTLTSSTIHISLVTLWLCSGALINCATVLLIAVGAIKQASNLLVTYGVILLPCVVLGLHAGGLLGFLLMGCVCSILSFGLLVPIRLNREFEISSKQKMSLIKVSITSLFAGLLSSAICMPLNSDTWLSLGLKACLQFSIIAGFHLSFNRPIIKDLRFAIKE